MKHVNEKTSEIVNHVRNVTEERIQEFINKTAQAVAQARHTAEDIEEKTTVILNKTLSELRKEAHDLLNNIKEFIHDRINEIENQIHDILNNIENTTRQTLKNAIHMNACIA